MINLINIKRAYEPAESSDGFRVLVDRLWPRGESKLKEDLNLWLKEVAPSTELREWFKHDPAKFSEFKEKYLTELKSGEQKIAFQQLQGIVKEYDVVTLVYAAKDTINNNAVVLKEALT